MRRTELHLHHPAERPIETSAVLEVGGVLDAVGAYDLRSCVEEALRAQAHDLLLDLSRVVTVDLDGLVALDWCVVRAAQVQARVTCGACSRPVRVALRDRGTPWASLV